MTESHFSTPAPIGDELLSAYIDGQVSAAERQRVEKALAADVQVQERFETFQMTVNLMQAAPPVRVPRAFALSEAQVLAAGGKVKGVEQPGLWKRLFPRLMPLATAAVALLLVVLVSIDLMPGISGGASAPQAVIEEMEIAAAPAQDEVAVMEMPAESAASEAFDMTTAVEITVEVEKEVMTTVVVEELAKREGAKPPPQEKAIAEDSMAAEAPVAQADDAIRAMKSTPLPLPTQSAVEAPMAAAPPPAPEGEMAANEAEPMLGAGGGATETFGTDSSVQETQPAESTAAQATSTAQASPVEEDNRGKAWLRPLEFILALLLVGLSVATLLLRKRTRADTP